MGRQGGLGPYDREFVKRLKEVIDLKDIDYIVMNHNEIDHSGALPELLREIPGTPIYCTKKGEAILRGHYHQDWNYVNVKTGDTLNIGKHTLTFIEAPMLHWPDTMFTYMSGDDILFSNDAFGQHYATESLFDTAADVQEVMYEAEKYYTNILNLYSPMVARKVKEVLGMNLPIKMIAPSHGVIWTKYIPQIIENYQKWSTPYQENQITIVYDTMWQSTRLMGEAIAEGIRRADPSVEVKLYNVAKEDKNDVLTQMFRSKAVLVGSPTINYLFVCHCRHPGDGTRTEVQRQESSCLRLVRLERRRAQTHYQASAGSRIRHRRRRHQMLVGARQQGHRRVPRLRRAVLQESRRINHCCGRLKVGHSN